MAKITEKKITDPDGRVIKVRRIEADYMEFESPDGAREVIRDLPALPRAEEWPYSTAGGPAEWQLFNVPRTKLIQIMLNRAPSAIRLLSENGDILLKLVGITSGGQMSAGSPDFDSPDALWATEAPSDS